MAPSVKRKSAPQGKRTAKASSKPPASPSGPFLRFYCSPALAKKALSVISALERAPDATAHRAALADVIVELTNSGMDSYFMQPLKLAKTGFIVQQTADLGLSGALRVMGSVIRNIITRMDAPQLLSVSGSIRRFMR